MVIFSGATVISAGWGWGGVTEPSALCSSPLLQSLAGFRSFLALGQKFISFSSMPEIKPRAPHARQVLFHCTQHSSYPPWWCLSEYTIQWHADHSLLRLSHSPLPLAEPFHGPQLSWLNGMDSLYPISQCNSLLVHTRSTKPWPYRVTLCLEPAYFISGVISAFLLAYFPQHNAIKVIYAEVWIRAFLFLKRLNRCIVLR